MSKLWHPQFDERGKPIAIHSPSKATDIASANKADMVASFVPGSPVPAVLNGIPFQAWADAPTTLEGWHSVVGQTDMAEPKLVLKGWKKAAAGVVIEETDGRVWLVSPTNAFGGYQQTFPKGKADKGLSLQAVAIKECFEESGLQVCITGLVGDFERTTSFARYYLARRVGGTPSAMGWESQAVHLVPKGELMTILDTLDDQKIAAAIVT